MSRRGAVRMAASLSMAVAVAGACVAADSGRLHQQAGDALERWAAAVEAAGGPGVVPVGELTSQVGTWEADVGGNNKAALMSGLIEAAPGALPADVPPDGVVRWQDGSTRAVRLLSAEQALAAIRTEHPQPCQGCRPLHVTAARLSSTVTETTKGPAEIPAWAFTVAGTSVVVTRLALADAVTVTPPPWDPYNAPVGLAISSATVSADGRRLIATFVGAPYPGDRPCGADYDGEAVESETAVVVIVSSRPHFDIGACTAVGAQRTVEVLLAAPLGDRAVLEVQQGLPVRVVRQR